MYATASTDPVLSLSQLFTKFWTVSEVGEECRFVGPAVNFFEQEHAKQLGHLVLGCSRIPVVWSKLKICHWVVRHELIDGIVGLVGEPCGGNGPDIFFQGGERTPVVQWRRIICWPFNK